MAHQCSYVRHALTALLLVAAPMAQAATMFRADAAHSGLYPAATCTRSVEACADEPNT